MVHELKINMILSNIFVGLAFLYGILSFQRIILKFHDFYVYFCFSYVALAYFLFL